ncbi:hypothetical protein AKJ16_DCAP00167 [Drosera capensis]
MKDIGGDDDPTGDDGGRRSKEEEQDEMSVHSPCKAAPPPSSASSLSKEQSQVELELRLLEALEVYPPAKLKGMHTSAFRAFWSDEILEKKFSQIVLTFALFWCSFDRQFSSDEVLQLLDRFYNLEMLKSDDDDIEILKREEEFSLSNFIIEEP